MKGESIDFSGFDKAVAELRKQLEEKVAIPTIDRVNSEIENFRSKIDFSPLLLSFEELKDSLVNRETSFKKEVDGRLAELTAQLSDSRGLSKDKFAEIAEEITRLKNIKPVEIPDFESDIKGVELRLKTLINQVESDAKDENKSRELKKGLDALEEELKKLRDEINRRFASLGGGAMNRQMYIGGADPLTRYTDMNLKAGSNVTITYVNNNTTKQVDVTISATGGGGGGTVRSINSISSDTTAGSTSGTDYVYLVSGTTTLTLPTAVGNTNLYTIKNVGTGVVTVATTGGETIDNAANVTMPVRYTAVDVISDTVNWNVT